MVVVQIPVYLLTDSISPYFQGFAVCPTSKYVSFSLVFTLMSKLQGKVFSYSILIHSNNLIQEFCRIPLCLPCGVCLNVWKWKPSNSGTFLAAVRQAVSTVAGSSSSRTLFLYQSPTGVLYIKAVVPFFPFLPYRSFCHNRFSFR